MTKRTEQKAERREAIIFAALDLFVSRGYASTKISDIAEKVDMSMGLLFHYFESKESLYEELVRIGLEGTKYPINQTYEHAIDYFTEFAGQLFAYLKVNPITGKLFVFMADAQRNSGVPKAARELALQINTTEAFVKIIEWGQAEGTIKAGNPLELSSAFWCSLQGVVENFVFHPEIPLPNAEWIVDIIRNNKRKGKDNE